MREYVQTDDLLNSADEQICVFSYHCSQGFYIAVRVLLRNFDSP